MLTFKKVLYFTYILWFWLSHKANTILPNSFRKFDICDSHSVCFLWDRSWNFRQIPFFNRLQVIDFPETNSICDKGNHKCVIYLNYILWTIFELFLYHNNNIKENTSLKKMFWRFIVGWEVKLHSFVTTTLATRDLSYLSW